MKKYVVIFLSFLLVLPVSAEQMTKKSGNLPDGVFKKTRSGEFVQYDKNGKKIGKYKVINGRFIKIK